MKKMNRKNYLDVVKLFASLCVIYVHAAPTYTPVRRTISAFFMPVFFIIYGMVSSKQALKSIKEWGHFLEKRVKSLLVPYALWGGIYAKRLDWIFVKNFLYGNNRSLSSAESHPVLWFLPCMFVSVILFQFMMNLYEKIKGKIPKVLFSLVIVVICGAISCIFNGYEIGGRLWGWDIAFSGCLFMIIGDMSCVFVEWIYKKQTVFLKSIGGIVLFFCTYIIVTINLPYLEAIGCKGVTMALGKYGRYDLFLLGAIMGGLGICMIGMVFEKIKLFVNMGKFSLVIMAVHYWLFIYVEPICNKIKNLKYGDDLYPIVVAIGCFAICIPICYIIDRYCPELNGKSIRLKQEG